MGPGDVHLISREMTSPAGRKKRVAPRLNKISKILFVLAIRINHITFLVINCNKANESILQFLTIDFHGLFGIFFMPLF